MEEIETMDFHSDLITTIINVFRNYGVKNISVGQQTSKRFVLLFPHLFLTGKYPGMDL
jgi:hypothetical protein